MSVATLASVIAAHQLARPGVLLAAGPVLPLGGQVLPHAGAGPLQRAVHGVDGVPEELRDVLRRPAEHVPQDQHGPRARREVLDCDQVRQLDRLPRDGDGLRLVRVARGQLVEQPVRVGLQPQHLAAGRRLRAALGEQVQAGVGGDPVQPGPERRPPLEGLPPPPGTQERLLHGVLGVLERPEHPVAVHVQLPPVPLRQPRERRLVDLAQTAPAQPPLTPSSSSRVSALITSSFRLVVSRRRCDGCGRDNSSLGSVGMADPVTDPVAEHDARYGEEGAGPPEWARVRDRLARAGVAWFTTTRRAWTHGHGTRSTEKDGLDLGPGRAGLGDSVRGAASGIDAGCGVGGSGRRGGSGFWTAGSWRGKTAREAPGRGIGSWSTAVLPGASPSRLSPDRIRFREAPGVSLDLIFLQMAGTAPSLKRRKVAEHAREEFPDRIRRVQR